MVSTTPDVSSRSRSLLRFVGGLGAALLFVAWLHTHGKIVRTSLLPLALIPFVPAWLVWKFSARDNAARQAFCRQASLLGLLMGLFLLLFSSPILHKWFFFLSWVPNSSPAQPLILVGLLQFLLLTTALIPFFLGGPVRIRRWLLALLLALQAGAFATLLEKTGGTPIYKDDHASMMFRLVQFAESFPQLANYLPHWNGGVVDEACVAAGVQGPGTLALPLLHLVPIEELYSPLIGVLYIGFVPFMAALSLRIMGCGRVAAAVAAILALGVSRFEFLWLLHRGTIGSILAASFVLPVSACLFRLFWVGRLGWPLALLLIFSAYMLLQWPPGLIMCAPIALAALCNARRWTRRKAIFLAGCALVTTLLMLRALFVLMDMTAAIHDQTLQATTRLTDLSLTEGFTYLGQHFHQAHPLLLILGVAGIPFLPQRSLRRWAWPILIGFIFILVWVNHWKPDLQLERMSIPLLFAAIPAAAVHIARMLKTTAPILAPVRAGLFALLLMGGVNVARIYAGDPQAPYSTASPALHELVDWLKQNVPPGGRVLFSGSSVHEYGGGHIAHIPLLMGREAVGADYYHFPLNAIEYDAPPAAFRRTPADMRRFMELYNVTHIICRNEDTRVRLLDDPDVYPEVNRIGNWSIHQVAREPSLFLQGSGTLAATFNRIDLALDDPKTVAVIAYNWIDGLEVDPPARIHPHDETNGVRLIAITPHGATNLLIRFR